MILDVLVQQFWHSRTDFTFIIFSRYSEFLIIDKEGQVWPLHTDGLELTKIVYLSRSLSKVRAVVDAV